MMGMAWEPTLDSADIGNALVVPPPAVENNAPPKKTLVRLAFPIRPIPVFTLTAVAASNPLKYTGAFSKRLYVAEPWLTSVLEEYPIIIQ